MRTGARRRPTELKLVDGGIAFIDEHERKVSAAIARARRRRDERFRVGDRCYAVYRIADDALPPGEAA